MEKSERKSMLNISLHAGLVASMWLYLNFIASFLDTLWEINNFETASAQNSNFAYIQENNNGVVCSKLFGKSYANGPIKCMGLNSHFI